MGLKLVVHRGFFFWNTEWAWNGFDFLLVLFSIFESPGFAEAFFFQLTIFFQSADKNGGKLQ